VITFRVSMALLQTLVLDSPGHPGHIEGAPALAVVLIVLGVSATFVIRFFVIRRNGKYTRVPSTNANAPYRPTPDLVGRTARDELPLEAAKIGCNVSVQVVDTHRTIQTELKIQPGGRTATALM
jgi:hypothetical protein